MNTKFRVVYFGPAQTNPTETQLFDTKFNTKDEAFTFADTKLSKLSYIQEFKEDGTPVNTITAKEFKQMIAPSDTKGKKNAKRKSS